MSGALAIEAHRLTRTFGHFRAVDEVSFTVPRGEVFGFLGSNGAGKTTTIRMLCGLLAPSSGSAAVAGLDVVTQQAALRQRIGYMSQRFSLYTDLTVQENLTFWGGAYGLSGRQLHQRREWALAVAGLAERRATLVRHLPGGVRQRLALVTALLHAPAVVFLDEPTGGVDPASRRTFWDLIDQLASEGTTVFVTTHVLDEAERCHRVALMHAGRLVALDTPARLKELLLPGPVLEVRGAPPTTLLPRIAQLAGVLDASLAGDAVRVLLAGPAFAAPLAGSLQALGMEKAQIAPAVPTLADAFIRAIAAAQGEERR